MKNKLTLVIMSVLIILCFSACGKTDRAKEAIIGEWIWNTGITTWHFVFNEDMTCEHYSGNRESEYSEYSISDDRITIPDMDWEFTYTIENDEIRLYHKIGDKTVEFIKNPSYTPVEALRLTDEIIGEIQEILAGEYYPMAMGITLTSTYLPGGYSFSDLEIKDQKQVDRYTYSVHCILQVKDDFGEKYSQSFIVSYHAVKSEEEPSGYKIEIKKISFPD